MAHSCVTLLHSDALAISQAQPPRTLLCSVATCPERAGHYCLQCGRAICGNHSELVIMERAIFAQCRTAGEESPDDQSAIL